MSLNNVTALLPLLLGKSLWTSRQGVVLPSEGLYFARLSRLKVNVEIILVELVVSGPLGSFVSCQGPFECVTTKVAEIICLVTLPLEK